jgi:hypothetical protein
LDFLAAAAAFVGIAALGGADGGYFPTSWGWSSLAFLWVAAVALLVTRQVRITKLETGFLGGLLALAIWIGASSGWSANVTQTVLEVERTLVYVSGVLMLLLLCRGRSSALLLGGILAGVIVVSAYALATRLFPERLGTYPIAGNRVSEPLTYTNALGILAAMGALLAVGFVARSKSWVGRALAVASLLILVPTLYFTFSRGAWIALGIGLLAAIALDGWHLRLITALLVATPAPAAAVILASRSDALTQPDAPLVEASQDGHQLALFIVLLGLTAAAGTVALKEAKRRLAFGKPLRLAYGAALIFAVAVGLGLVFARYGSPPTLASKAYDSFRSPPPATTDPNERLFTSSGNWRAENWSVAWSNYEAHPWLGSGAGTYEQAWMLDRPVAVKVRDAHNLYLETLSELGPVGFTLLLGALAFPIVAGIKARNNRFAPLALGAYVAYLIHASIDWDWEMPAVTLPALFCGVALLVAARIGEPKPLPRRGRIGALALILVLVCFAFVGLVSNRALTRSAEEGLRGNIMAAQAEARTAARWAPWSYQPWQQLGELELAEGSLAQARMHLRLGIARNGYDWELWLNLALASDGPEQLRALTVASRLNPRSPQIAEVARSLGIELGEPRAIARESHKVIVPQA